MDNGLAARPAISLADAGPRRSIPWAARVSAFAAMLAMGWLFRCDHLTDWDSWDYAAQAIMGHRSDLALGRWWFIAAMRGAWLAGHGLFGLTTDQAYLPMQIASAGMMALAVVAGMAWTRRLTGNAAAEAIFAAMVVMGPVVGIYTFSAMTEGMTLLSLSLALWAWEVAREKKPEGETHTGRLPSGRKGGTRSPRLRAFVAGLAFGVAIDVREPVALLGLWPLLDCLVGRSRRSWGLLGLALLGAAVTLAVGILCAAVWAPWTEPGQSASMSGYFDGIRNWAAQMGREDTLHHVPAWRNGLFLIAYCACCVPAAGLLALPAAVWSAFRIRKGASRCFWLMVSLVPLAIVLLQDQTLSVNVRHPLVLAWMIAPVAAAALDAWLSRPLPTPSRRLNVALALVLTLGTAAVCLGWRVITEKYFNYAADVQNAYLALRTLPDDATVVAGPGTPAAYHLNRIGEKRFDVIASGWAWPQELAERIAQGRSAGRPVYVYCDAAGWTRSIRPSDEWRALQREIEGHPLGGAIGPYRKMHPPEYQLRSPTGQ